MFETLQVVLPIFLVIVAGYGSAALRLLGSRVADGLSEFVFVVAIPVLLFRTLATAPLPEAQPWFYWLAYFGALALVWIATTLVVRRFFAMGGREAPIAAFSTVQGNTVFIGIPLILRAFGDPGTVPMFLMIAIHLPLTMTVATLLVEQGGADGGKADWAGMLRKLATHPILIGIMAGVAWRLTGLPLPGPANAAARIIAEAAAPTALFALGMTLRQHGLSAPPALIGVMAGFKLLLQPALVYLFAFHLLPMPPVWAAVAVLFAACPCGVNGYLLAQRYNVGVAMSSSAIAATTILAVVTTTGWLWLVSGVK